ncbi:MAG: DUF86 domain-containing protein [Myxococcales bacterium]
MLADSAPAPRRVARAPARGRIAESWPAANNLGDAFTGLEERGVIASSLARALRKAVGLRNVVAHGYARVDPGAIHSAATTGLADLEAFSQAVASWAASWMTFVSTAGALPSRAWS